MKHAGWFLLVAIVFFAGDRAAGWQLGQWARQSQFRYARLYTGRAGADLLLIGNSRGLGFYQPFISTATGRSNFNLSYNGLSASLAEALTLDYLERYPAPRKVLIDITLCDRPNAELAAGFTTYAPYSKRLDSLIRVENRDAWNGSHFSDLFRYNNEVFQRALFYKNRPDTDWLIDRQIAPALAAATPMDTFPISVQPPLIAHLARLVAGARAAGSEVVLLIGPYYPNMTRDWSNLDALRAAVEKATGLPVHDYRQALTDPTDFGDLMHPNKRGAERWMGMLAAEGYFE